MVAGARAEEEDERGAEDERGRARGRRSSAHDEHRGRDDRDEERDLVRDPAQQRLDRAARADDGGAEDAEGVETSWISETLTGTAPSLMVCVLIEAAI